MSKTIKSGVRVRVRMISKFQEKEAEFYQKHNCLRVVLNFLGNLEDVEEVDAIVRIIGKLTALEQKDRVKSQNQYFKEIASSTGVSLISIHRIKKEGATNQGVWSKYDLINQYSK